MISQPIVYLKSIQDLHLLGELQFGIYEKLHSSPKSHSDVQPLPDTTEIMNEQQVNINHEVIHVPLHQNPFGSDKEELLFFLISVKPSHKILRQLALDLCRKNGSQEYT